MPEDSNLSKEDVERIEAYSKTRGLSNDQAQDILNLESESKARYDQAQVATVEQLKIDWRAQAELDSEIGGDNFARNAELAKRVVDRFGADEFRQALNNSGFGNNPEVLRIFARIGKAMSDDQLVIGGAAAGAGEKSMEELFYGNQNKE